MSPKPPEKNQLQCFFFFMSIKLLIGYHLFTKEQILTLYPWHLSLATSVQFLAAQFGCKKNDINVPENLMVRPSFKYVLRFLTYTHVYRRMKIIFDRDYKSMNYI